MMPKSTCSTTLNAMAFLSLFFLVLAAIPSITVTAFSNLNEGEWKSRPMFPELAKPPSSSDTKNTENSKSSKQQQQQQKQQQQEKWDPIRFISQSSKFISLPSIPFSDTSTIMISPGDVLWGASSSNEDNNNDNFFTFAPLDDVVMGGVSSSTFDGGIWKGTVSEANSGGFVGIRSTPFRFDGLNMEKCNGIEVVTEGLKGKGLKIVLRDSKDFNGICWTKFVSDRTTVKNPKFDLSSLFASLGGTKSKDDEEETIIQIPLEELIPTIFARTVPDAILNPNSIQGFQFAYSKFLYNKELNPDFELGDFEIYLKEIRAY